MNFLAGARAHVHTQIKPKRKRIFLNAVNWGLFLNEDQGDIGEHSGKERTELEWGKDTTNSGKHLCTVDSGWTGIV